MEKHHTLTFFVVEGTLEKTHLGYVVLTRRVSGADTLQSEEEAAAAAASFGGHGAEDAEVETEFFKSHFLVSSPSIEFLTLVLRPRAYAKNT